ncbi:hypothetical protein LTR28_003069, partial [Elasticomyces elasticus]
MTRILGRPDEHKQLLFNFLNLSTYQHTNPPTPLPPHHPPKTRLLSAATKMCGIFACHAHPDVQKFKPTALKMGK